MRVQALPEKLKVAQVKLRKKRFVLYQGTTLVVP
jgi:hypothetical protein